MLTTTVAAALAAAWLGVQQDRPTEEQLFGAPAQEAPPAQAKPAPEQKPGAQQGGEEQRPSEEEIFGGSRSRAAEPTPPEAIERAAEAEPLRIGGLIYLRAQTLWQEGESPRDWFLSSPNLTDLYLDVRPNDRVRGFVLGRLFYDPTIVTGGSASAGAATLAPPITIAGLGSVQPTSNPYGVLDQLWITSDIGRTVFVTAGRQHVKWGVGRFWNPTDYLHPIRRDPLAVFDVRTGSSMVRLQLPWEARGWNLYGVAMAEDVAGAPIPVNTLGRVAWGGRAEAVLGTVELGADALVQQDHRPRFGVDASAGIWDLDIYAEAALRTGTDYPRWREVNPAATILGGRYAAFQPQGFTPFVVAGGTWTIKYSDEDSLTLGAEYAWNEVGYTDPAIYPFLVAGAPTLTGNPLNPVVQQDTHAYRPFYLGRQYAAAFVALPKPGRWNNTDFTLSVLGNLSDRSFVARLDHSVLVLTYLRLETFVAASFGHKGGEFRLGFDIPADQIPAPTSISVPVPVLQLGIAARVSL
ncbi:MAG TPA: hypothetical protein VM753_16975 [Anaeromyxobacter sp.]|nr:hypothetical protein [Anaeromyxobacter sp.]